MDQVENSVQSEGFEFSSEDVVIDPYTCDLNLVVDKDCLLAYPLSNDGFCSMWAGCRSTFGVNSGRVAFEVHLEDHCETNDLPKDDLEPHLIRLGWSLNHSPLQLGESPFSFGFCNNAKKCCDKLFENFGEVFEKGDSIAAYLDFESIKNHVVISFSKNGLDLGTAFKINVKDIRDYSRKTYDEENFVFFPHVLSKNIVFEMNFGQRVSLIGDEPFAPIKSSFELIQKISLDKRFSNTVVSKNKKDYQVVIMIGLPGCGKSKWVKDFCEKNFDKNYYVIGIGSILEKMKVLSQSKKANSSQTGDFTTINSITSYAASKVQPDLLDKVFKCMNSLMEIASQSCRNIIIDQANVFQSTRRRKLKIFKEYTTKAVCLIPTDDVYQERLSLSEKEDGKSISINLINDMKIGFSLPNLIDFDEIEYAELNEQEAFNLVECYNSEAQTDRLNLLLERRAKKNEEKRKSLAINPTLLMRPVYRPNYAFATGISSLSSQFYAGNRFSRSLPPPRRHMVSSFSSYSRPGIAYPSHNSAYGTGYAMMQNNLAGQQWNPALPYQGTQPYLQIAGQYAGAPTAWPPQYQTGQNQWDPVVSTNLSQSLSTSTLPNNLPQNNQN